MTGSPNGRPRFDLIVFDFDGTLCDSVDVKTRAFHQLYLDEQGEAFADRVLAYHLAHQGVSRYDKITHIEQAFLGNPGDPESVAVVADRFGVLVEDAVVEAPLFPGVLPFLERTTGTTHLAVASATPTDELRRIVDRKGIGRLFAAVEGSPRSKGDILADLATRFGSTQERMVMVGDQPSDARAADTFGIEAAIIASPAGWNEAHHTFASFHEVATWLETAP